jgi:hypothetical protein
MLKWLSITEGDGNIGLAVATHKSEQDKST